MTRFLLLILTLLILSSSSAYAEWVEVEGGGKFTAYVDPETIRRKGNLVKIWVLDDYKTVRAAADKSYLSVKALDEYDCAEEQIRNLALYAYSGQMGTGEIVESISGVPSKWAPVIPGSVGQTKWKLVCDKK